MSWFPRQLPGLSVGLLRVMFGILWLDMALQKAPWVINPQGRRFGWLSNWLWTEMQHPTFGFYKALLEHVVWPHFTFFVYAQKELDDGVEELCRRALTYGRSARVLCDECG